MPISWTAALRLYGKTHGGFVVPKKGTAHYDAVKKLMAETADGPEHAVKKRMSKKGAAEKMAVVAESHEPTKKARRAPTAKGGAAPEVTRNHDAVVPPAAGTKPLEAGGGAGSRAQKELKRPEVEDAGEKPVKKRRGVRSSGLTAGAATQEFLANDNTMGGGAASAQMGGQKKRLAKTLEQKPDEAKIVTVGEGEERTLEGMKTDDPKAVEGKAPFSIQALRNRLLC
jgi:hypothetical protein